MVMGILRVPALAGEPGGCHIDRPPVALASALVTLCCFHRSAFRRCFCEKVKMVKRSAQLVKVKYNVIMLKKKGHSKGSRKP